MMEIDMKKRWMQAGMVMAMLAALMSSGCWGLVLYGRPGPGRNDGPIDWGVVILDLVFLGLIGVGIDACAGTLRRPGGYPSCWSDNNLKINVRPEDLEKNGDRTILITCVGADGSAKELYSGPVRDAQGLVLPMGGCSGRVEVRLDGSQTVAWSAPIPGARTQLAAR